MTSVNKFFIFFLALTLAVFFQRGGFLNVGGIVPNLVLALFALAIVEREGIAMVSALVAALFLFTLVTDSFWAPDLGLMGLIALLLVPVRRWLTGNAFLDLIFLIAIGEIIFYGIGIAAQSSPFVPTLIGKEFVYTTLLAIPLLVGYRRMLE